MSCGPLPSDDHVARVCLKRCVQGPRVLPTAFILRSQESSLSVNWLEKHGGDSLPDNVDRVRARISEQGILTLKRKHRFIVVNVGDAGEKLPSLSVIHDSTENDDSHSLIRGYTNDDDSAMAMLANLASKHEIHAGLAS